MNNFILRMYIEKILKIVKIKIFMRNCILINKNQMYKVHIYQI